MCGRCGEILPGRYRSGDRADRAADDHAETVHPERPSTLVIPVSERLSRERGPEVIAVAVSLQAGTDGVTPSSRAKRRRDPQADDRLTRE